MKVITLRATDELLARLDAFCRARGFSDRSHAIRTAIREASMTPEERMTVPDRAELLCLLGERARDGNVQAIKVLLEEHRRSEEEQAPETIFDQLARQRDARRPLADAHRY